MKAQRNDRTAAPPPFIPGNQPLTGELRMPSLTGPHSTDTCNCHMCMWVEEVQMSRAPTPRRLSYDELMIAHDGLKDEVNLYVPQSVENVTLRSEVELLTTLADARLRTACALSAIVREQVEALGAAHARIAGLEADLADANARALVYSAATSATLAPTPSLILSDSEAETLVEIPLHERFLLERLSDAIGAQAARDLIGAEPDGEGFREIDIIGKGGGL